MRRVCVRTASVALLLAVLTGTACAQGIVHTIPPQPLYYSPNLTSRLLNNGCLSAARCFHEITI